MRMSVNIFMQMVCVGFQYRFHSLNYLLLYTSGMPLRVAEREGQLAPGP